MKINKNFIFENIMILIGTFMLNVGFYFLFAPNNLVTGGVTGVAVILSHYGLPLSLTILLFNIIFLVIGFIVLGVSYGLRSIYASLLSPAIVFIFELFAEPDFFINYLTESPLLISTLLGALSVGFGLGLVFRNNGSTGGIDILQNILNKKFHLDYKTIFILTDGLIVLVGFIVLQDFQNFLYAIGAILLFSVIIDNLSIAGRAGHTLFIVTSKADIVKKEIHDKLERGTTILDARGGFSDESKELVICVINKKQLNYARVVVAEADPEAFTFISQTKEAVGLGFTRH